MFFPLETREPVQGVVARRAAERLARAGIEIGLIELVTSCGGFLRRLAAPEQKNGLN